jgi:hypothetical protein
MSVPQSIVIELGRVELELSHDISRAGPSGDLGEPHHGKPRPAIAGAALALRAETVLFDFSKIMSARKKKQLMEDWVTICHDLDLLSGQCVMPKPTIQGGRTSRNGASK